MAQYIEVAGNVVEFPDGMTPDAIAAAIKANPQMSQPAAAVGAGKAVNSIPRQVGLTARYGLEGLANMAQIGTEPIRYLTDRLTGQTGKTKPLGALVTEGLDAIGLPSPQGANERVVGDATRLVAGTGAGGIAARLAGGASPLLQFAGRDVAATVGAPQNAGQFLSANMPQQLASAAGAGLAGGASREAGGSPLMQGAAALAGGVAGGMAPGAINSTVGAAKSAIQSMRPQQMQMVQQRIDQTINVTLQNQGIDPATITPAMRAALREQVGKAMNIGGGGTPLNPEAVGRLADYTRLNMTPTRSRLTLDPFDVTQEQNASKLAAATGDRSARLPQIAQDNNARLVSLIDDMGGSRPVDAYGQGAAVTGAIRNQDNALETGVTGLYNRARGTDGRSLPLDGAAFTTRANAALDEAMVGGALPADVAGHLNRIARGEVPFTVDYAEQLKTRIGALQRATNDGSARMALGAVRRALDDTPLMNAPQVNPGNLPAVPGTVPPSPSVVGRESINAFNEARRAARDRFAWQESSPAFGRALDGANADTFVAQNVLSKAAGFEQVAALANVANRDPAARDAIRTSIVQHLKDAAIGKGGESATGNFSGRNMNAALKELGDRKLGLFFDANEIETLKAMARAGSFEIFQPRGSAVNNSATAAGVGGLLQSLSKYVKPIANRLPAGEMAISKPLDYITAGLLQRPAMNLPEGLLMQQPKQPLGQGLLLPGIAAGGLLAAP